MRQHDRDILRNKVLGLGEKSLKKNYYNELQTHSDALQRFRTLIDKIEDMIIICHIPDGIIIDANKSCQDFFRFALQEETPVSVQKILGSPFINHLSYFFSEKSIDNYHNCINLSNFEISLKRRDFDVSVTFNKYGSNWFATILLHDISERKIIETALHENREYLQAILDQVDDAIFIQDVEDFKVIDINKSVLNMFGYDYDETDKMCISKLSLNEAPYTLNEASEYLMRSRENGPQTFEWKARHKDGTIFWVEITVKYAKTSNQQVFITVVRNINDRKLQEENRYKLEQQMQHTQKLESLGILAGGIAHDFNNILTAILGHSELSLLKLSKPEIVQNHLNEIKNAAKRAAELSQQMLAYSGKGQFILEPVNLNQVIKEMMELLKVSISKKITLTLRLDSEISLFEGGISQIRQVIMNLITNASEAIGDKEGEITITTGNCCLNDYDKKALFVSQEIPKGRCVFFEVSDNGCGMTKEIIDKIFDPFFTTKFTGRGLGMSAVLGIVRGHKGMINIYSEVGKGTIFKIYLPALDSQEELQPLCNPIKTMPFTINSKKVLIVDDEPEILRVANEYLSILGVESVIASNGLEALKILEQNSNEFELFLLDLTMPIISGEETCQKIMNINQNAKVILMSGFSEYELKMRYSQKGFSDFLQKPFTFETFKQKIFNTISVNK